MSSTNFIDFVNTNTTCGMDACFTAFDKNCDNKLDLEEFRILCQALFRNNKGETYELKENELRDVFRIFDVNTDQYIDRQEFTFCWHNWIKIIVRPISAILIIDVQNDFICGTLDIRNCPAKQNAEEILQPINNILETIEFDAIFYSYDWHPSDHVSFIDNINLRKLHQSSPITDPEKVQLYDSVVFEGDPPITQRMWPRHCVQNTWGSELHKDLKVAENAIKIYKGTNPEVDSYSAFWDNSKLTDTKLAEQLKVRNITDVYVCGVAYDVCVGATAIDAISSGFRTILLDDCCRGVDLLDIEKTKNTVIKNHGIVVNSERVKNMVEGNDRRPELGYKLALNLKEQQK
ncbi:nicotinamidase [Diorhabda carinulata]|uniref:nicotinamidase n=1 Tax=Diorhabda sublineata TaxID=1163346 RepID=UPI0024E0D10D|nr:nicotinamidase [Diorhabda sublineata]XP_057670310.1 nicotinamidase [Diorhabda carinulata]